MFPVWDLRQGLYCSDKVKHIYQRQELKLEQAEAWRVLGERLSLLVTMDDSNVVLMQSAKTD